MFKMKVVFSILCYSVLPVLGVFNPFTDTELFDINWAGPRLDKLEEDLEVVEVQTADREKYQCILPESQAAKDAQRKAHYGGQTPDEIMEKLFAQNACSYRIESYWTYELCHGKHIKQYHENKQLGLQKPRIQEYFLGVGIEEPGGTGNEPDVSEEKTETPESEAEPVKEKAQVIPTMKIDGLELPFFSVNMSGGTECDLTGKHRRSHVKYICQPDGRGEIFQLKETSSCEYDIVVLTAHLCVHPEFTPKDPPVNKINCHSLDGSPREPRYMAELVKAKTDSRVLSGSIAEDTEQPKVIYTEGTPHRSEVPQAPEEITQPHAKPQPPVERPQTNIGKLADSELLRQFLKGDYCLHGSSGWWNHEFCYGKHLKQYHRESDGVTTSIYLGYWDKQKHLAWLEANPSKRPKAVGYRKELSLYYSEGDVCDLTGQKRFVQVKMKCISNLHNSPHAVSISLIEPKPCEYIVRVESPIFCGVLDSADDDGLLDHIEV